MKAAAGLLLLVLAANAQAAKRPEETLSERHAVERVVSAIDGKDCALASKRLNEGLADQYSGIYLMAGAMFEEGLCLKPSWERAAQMYQKALALGHQGGLYRLISGYAYQNRDPAVAVWMAQEPGALQLPEACRVPAWVHADPAAFAATLTAWPAGRLQACTYVAGVMATVAGDTEYPRVALNFQLAGQVAMRFVPAAGSIDWRTMEVDDTAMVGVVSGDTLRDRQSRAVRDSMRSYLEQAGQAALKRYNRPEGIDPNWKLESVYVFSIKIR